MNYSNNYSLDQGMGCGAILVLILCCLAVALVDGNVEVDALHEWRQIVYDPNDVMLSWDPTLVNPCTWFHITCNTNNSVTRVDVGNAGLSGSLTPALANLTNLQYFQAFGNNLTGAIPKELGRLTNLVSLNLSNNQLSGSIPRSLGNLKSLSLLGLNSNALTGDIPTKLLQLVPLGRLRLFNVSHNFLAGSLSSGKSKGGDVMTIIVQDPRA